MIGWAGADGNQSNQSTAYILDLASREELITFANEAKDFVLAEGKDKALQVFNDPKGKFVRGEHYIVAQDLNGTLLAHPFRPKEIGQNALNSTDSNGVVAYANMIDMAKRGNGFGYHIRANPAHSNAEELRLTYNLKVDEGLCLSSGMYLPGEAPIFSNKSREDLIAFVENARDFALNNTKDVALKAFNNRNGEFVRGNLYIFAYDFKGNTLALPFQPKLVGTNRLDIQDPNGVYLLQEISDVAKRGSGFAYVIYNDPAENMTYKLKLDYVTKVDDEWFLGSGIYWP